VLLFLSAVLVVYVAAYRALDVEELFRKNRELEDLLPYRSIEGRTAILFPIVGSISLLLFFYFFDYVAVLVVLTVCVYSAIGMVFVLYPIFERLFKGIAATEIRVPCCGSVPTLYVILLPITSFSILMWIITGHWLLNNAIGITMTILAISFIQVPSIRIASLVLVGLFFYDIFWVFYSVLLFKENVMVAVATKQANNPAAVVAKTLNIPSDSISPTLHLPMKLIWGHTMLGLGDMVIPGLLVAFVKRFDHMKGKQFMEGYFIVGLIGYAVGMFVTMIAAFVYGVAQPALLYLVPSTLIPILVVGYRRGELSELWNGTGLERLGEEPKYTN